MTRQFWRLAALIVASAAALAPAFAVDREQAKTTETPAVQQHAPASAQSADMAAKGETPAVLVDDSKLESILGKPIHSSSGETLGTVTDVLFERDGSVRAAVVDFGEFLGVGVRKVAVSWSALHFLPGKEAFDAVLSMSKDQLRGAPEYRAGEPIVIVGAEPQTTGDKPNSKD